MTDNTPTPNTPVDVTVTDLGHPAEDTGGDHVALPTTVVEPIWFPNQRVIRTTVQVIVSVVSLLGVVAVLAPQILDAVKAVLPASWVAWLVGAIAFVAGLSAALSRVMAIPAVNELLTRFGAGSTTRSASRRAAQSKSIS